MGPDGYILIMVPLNSKTSLDMAVTVALIMWGVAPARPAATIVMYSSRLALADLPVQYIVNWLKEKNRFTPSPTPSSSMPSTKLRFTTPPSAIFLPIAIMSPNAAPRVFSEGSFIPRTASGISNGITCKVEGGIEGSKFAYSCNRSCVVHRDKVSYIPGYGKS